MVTPGELIRDANHAFWRRVRMQDFSDRPDPLTFQGLVGAAIARGCYSELFGKDGWVKTLTELKADKRTAKLLDGIRD